MADSTAPGIRGLYRSGWGCTWEAGGPLAPVDTAASGALADCYVHKPIDEDFPAGISAYDPLTSGGGIDGWGSISLAGGGNGSSATGVQVFHSSAVVHKYCAPFSPLPNPCECLRSCASRRSAGLNSILSVATAASSAVARSAGPCVRFVEDADAYMVAESQQHCKRLILQAARAFRTRYVRAGRHSSECGDQGPAAGSHHGLCTGQALPCSADRPRSWYPDLRAGQRCKLSAGHSSLPQPEESFPVCSRFSGLSGQAGVRFRPDESFPARRCTTGLLGQAHAQMGFQCGQGSASGSRPCPCKGQVPALSAESPGPSGPTGHEGQFCAQLSALRSLPQPDASFRVCSRAPGQLGQACVHVGDLCDQSHFASPCSRPG